MELKKSGRSWFGATQYVMTLWGLGKKTAAILLLIGSMIPFVNFVVIMVAFIVCGLNTRTWLYEKADRSDEKKDGINEFITNIGKFLMVLSIIIAVAIVIALAG
jgi:Trk-type K+ transport system membrane component